MTVTTGEIFRYLDNAIPLALQEDYDNSGLQTGSYNVPVSSILLTIDVNQEVVREAIDLQCNLIISHHPLIFSPLKRVADNNPVQQTVMAAVKNDIAIYSSHTNLDSLYEGVSFKMAEKLGITGCTVLSPYPERLVKLVVFVPSGHIGVVSDAVYEAGAGHIGNYDRCGYRLEGEGTFRANSTANPFVGTKGEIHHEPEIRFETILPSYNIPAVVKALIASHPYEEPAFDMYPLLNRWDRAGLGCIGELPEPLGIEAFLSLCKRTFSPVYLRHTRFTGSTIKKVALCGGAGASLTGTAKAAGADAFVTGDIKYHQFADAGDHMLLVDAGHYETEKFSMEIIYDLIIKKFPNFALRFSETITNPINCY